MQRRYQSLQLHSALSRRKDYQEACRELRCVLRGAYIYASKAFQAQLYHDVMHAFRTLPGMDHSRQLQAAKALLQTVQELFPPQRAASAAHEYTTAVTARHRQYKNPEPPPERLELSRDILLHVFKSLDARSLAIASAVCREWNVAATDDTLWHAQFFYLFGTPNLSANDGRHQVLQTPLVNTIGVWRQAFNLAAQGQPAHLLTSNRAYCSVCNEVIWKPAKGKCVASKQILEFHSPRPMSVSQVVRYMVCTDIGSIPEPSSIDSGEE